MRDATRGTAHSCARYLFLGGDAPDVCNVLAIVGGFGRGPKSQGYECGTGGEGEEGTFVWSVSGRGGLAEDTQGEGDTLLSRLFLVLRPRCHRGDGLADVTT